MAFDLNDMINKEVLDKFAPVINAIPERVRDEENGRYCFPEEYCNSIFRLGNKFLIFNTTSYDEISFNLLIFILRFISLTNLVNNDSNVEIPDNYLDQISGALNGLSKRIELLDKKLSENDIKFENIQDLFNKLDVNVLTDTKEEIEKLINSFKATDSNLEDEYENLTKDIEELKEKVANINTPVELALPEGQGCIDKDSLIDEIGSAIWKKLEENNDTVSMEIFNQFKNAIEKSLSQLKYSINNPAPLEERVSILNPTICSDSIDVNKLKELKDVGFSIIEIAQLKQFGLI